MRVFMAVVLGLAICGQAGAAIIFQDSFDGSQDAWLDSPDLADPNSSWADTGLLGANVHQSSTGDGGAGGAKEYVYTDDTDVQGDWTAMGSGGIKTISTRFYADSGVGDGAAALVTLYFQDSSGQHWFASGLTAVGGWTTYSVSLDYASWYSTDGDDEESDWLASLSDVEQVGVYVSYHPGVDNQIYAIDDFVLDDAFNTPEPGTFYFLGVAFASMGIGFRKRVRAFMDGIFKKS